MLFWGGTDRIQHFVDEGYYFIWGIHMIGRNVLTEELFKRLNVPLDRLVTIIHYTAFIGENVVLHPGVVVMCHAYIAPRTELGIGTMVKSILVSDTMLNVDHYVILQWVR